MSKTFLSDCITQHNCLAEKIKIHNSIIFFICQHCFLNLISCVTMLSHSHCVTVTVWLVIHVMFIEHEHRFLEHEHRFIKLHVVLLLVRALKNSCPNPGHVTCTAEFSSAHSHILLSSLCLVLYVSNTKYSMVFQSISVLLYLDITRHHIYI